MNSLFRAALTCLLFSLIGLTTLSCSEVLEPDPAVGVSADSDAGSGPAPSGGPQADTPEAVFQSAHSAIAREDWRTVSQCLTPESRDAMAGMLISMVAALKNLAAYGTAEQVEQAEEKFKPAVELLDKHGINQAALQRSGAVRGQVRPEAMAELLAPIEDRNGFVAELFDAIKTIHDPSLSSPLPLNAQLQDVVIEGDRATGQLVETRGGMEVRNPIHFQQIDGSWHIDFTGK